jgi:hypothetical protein
VLLLPLLLLLLPQQHLLLAVFHAVAWLQLLLLLLLLLHLPLPLLCLQTLQQGTGRHLKQVLQLAAE